MSSTVLYRLGLRTAGILLLVVGAMHLLLPTHGYSSDTFNAWNTETKDHFLFLATYMIGAFLISLSVLTFIYSAQKPSRPIAWFATVSTGLWILRLFLEFSFPVKLSLFFLEQPHAILMAAIGIIVAAYALASGIAWGQVLIRK